MSLTRLYARALKAVTEAYDKYPSRLYQPPIIPSLGFPLAEFLAINCQAAFADYGAPEAFDFAPLTATIAT